MNATPRSMLREPGFWLALLLVVAQATNALRVAVEPAGFAVYFGVPLAHAGDAAWVGVFALRTGFIAIFAAYLLWRREVRVLAAFALVALLLPIGDLVLVVAADAPTATIARHAVIAGVLVAAWAALARWARRLNGS